MAIGQQHLGVVTDESALSRWEDGQKLLMARLGAMMFALAGPSVVVGSWFWDDVAGMRRVIVLSTAVAGSLFAPFVYLMVARGTNWLVHLAIGIGVALVTFVTAITDGANSPTLAFAFLPAAYAAYFLPWKQAAFHVYTVVLLLLGGFVLQSQLTDTEPNPLSVGALSITIIMVSIVASRAHANVRAAVISAERRSRIDPLTGLANRRALQEQLSAQVMPAMSLGGQAGGPVAPGPAIGFVMIDLDDFKGANTLFGHLGGDRLLKAVADALKSVCLYESCVARLGGDEFAVLLVDATEEEVKAVEALCSSALRILDEQQQSAGYSIAASTGYAIAPRDGQTLDQLITTADAMIRAAKQRKADGRIRPGGGPHLVAGPLRDQPVVEQSSELAEPGSSQINQFASNWSAWQRHLAVVAIGALVLAAMGLSGGMEGPLIWLALVPVAAAGYLLGSMGIALQGSLVAMVVALPVLVTGDSAVVDQLRNAWLALSLLLICGVFVHSRRTAAHYEACADELALLDPLTGLGNLRAFRKHVGDAIAMAEIAQAELGGESQFGVVVVDMDNFKQANTLLGHAGGDTVLSAVGCALRRACRADDFVTRFGGDEFAAIVSYATQDDLNTIADRCMTEIFESASELDELGYRPSGSVGTALWPQDGSTLEELLAVADTRMRASKSDAKRGYGRRRASLESASVSLSQAG